MTKNCTNVDRITGLPDGAALDKWLRSREESAPRSRVTVLWIDIDDVEAIRLVATALREAVDTESPVFRHGPGELIAVLPGTGVVDAWVQAEGLRQRVAGTPISVGIVTLPCSELAHETIELAEAAAELARRWGGNRICTWDMVEVDGLLRTARGHGHDLRSRRDDFLIRAGYLLGPTQREQLTCHCDRVAELATQVASSLAIEGIDLERIRSAALLHELGMCAVPEPLLAATETLSLTEWALVASHAELGAEMARTLDAPAEICDLIRHHHDRYDLHGATLPMGARILAVTDALISLGSDGAAEVALESGRRFDPVIVAAALRLTTSSTRQAA